MVEGATALLKEYGGDVHFYIRGERLAGRYHEIRMTGVDGPLESFGGNVKLGLECDDFGVDLDKLAQVKTIGPLRQPTAYPAGQPSATGWSKLGRTAGKWFTNPEYRPRTVLPKRLRPLPNHLHRLILDGDVLDDREADLLRLVKSFEGDIAIITLSEVWKELQQGHSTLANWRMKHWNNITSAMPSSKNKKNEMSARSKPTVYPDSMPPKTGDWFTGDLQIRVEIGRNISALRSQHTKSHVHVLFITGDYGSSELARAIQSSSHSPNSSYTFRCLRLDKREKGTLLERIVHDVIGEWCRKD